MRSSIEPYARVSLMTLLPKCEVSDTISPAALIAHGAAAHRERVRRDARRILRVEAPVGADHQRVRVVDDVVHARERGAGVRVAIVADAALERGHALRVHEREKARDGVGGDAETAERRGVRAQERGEIVVAPPPLRGARRRRACPSRSGRRIRRRAGSACSRRRTRRCSAAPLERAIAQRVGERAGGRVRCRPSSSSRRPAAELPARHIVRVGDDARGARGILRDRAAAERQVRRA